MHRMITSKPFPINFSIVFANIKSHCETILASTRYPTKNKSVHQSFEDSSKSSETAKELIAEFRKVRNEIKDFSQEFIKNI